jgi:hypothetical protein
MVGVQATHFGSNQQRIVADVHGDRARRRIAMTEKPAKRATRAKPSTAATAAERAKAVRQPARRSRS